MATRGATSWPRVDEPRPPYISLGEYLIEFVLMFGRPTLQVVALVMLSHPLYLSLATYCTQELACSEGLFFAALTVGTHHTGWSLANGFFLALDRFGWLRRFRIPTSDASLPSAGLRREAVVGSVLGGVPMFLGAWCAYPAYAFFGTTPALARRLTKLSHLRPFITCTCKIPCSF